LEPKQRALQVINQNAEQIADVGDSIWSFAELGMQEYETHDLLVKVLSQEGFRIDPIEGFPTAVMATYGSGKPVIAVAVNHERLSREETDAACDTIREETGLPTCAPLQSGVAPLVEAVRERLKTGHAGVPSSRHE